MLRSEDSRLPQRTGDSYSSVSEDGFVQGRFREGKSGPDNIGSLTLVCIRPACLCQIGFSLWELTFLIVCEAFCFNIV